MSVTIDERVVEMRFDNKQFEQGVSQTMGTLSKLKEALKFSNTSKALEGIDKATKDIKLDGIASGVSLLEKRFSTLGIVGMRVIENITDAMMGKFATAVNFATDSIVSGGIKRAMNIENAHFQLQALLKDEAKVQAVMNNAMESVDGTAYAYDEAAKAASQFAASGLEAGEEMLSALKGITGVAAMTNSEYEGISRIFTTVAGQGRLMGDQLLQLSSRGMNAAATIADWFREVQGQAEVTEAVVREMVSDGEISFRIFADAMGWAFGDAAERANETFTGAFSNVKSALARIGAGFVSPLIEQNGVLVDLFNALRIQINNVKSDLVFDEQRSAIAGLSEATGIAKDSMSDLFKIVKLKGSVTSDEMNLLSRGGIDAAKALEEYINGVEDGSIRSSYAIKTAVDEMTNGMKVSTEDVTRFVNSGMIDLDMFTAAMEKSFGTEKNLSKQFTDFFQDTIADITDKISKADLTKPLEVFNIWVSVAKNLFKGLYSVLKPIGSAFSDVYLSFSADDVIKFSKSIEKLTSKLKLSDKASKNLKDTFKGVFSVVKLLIDAFFGLFGIVSPITGPVESLSGGLLDLTGAIGRSLTKFTEWIRVSPKVSKAYEVIKTAVKGSIDFLKDLIGSIGSFLDYISGFDAVQNFIEGNIALFSLFGESASENITGVKELVGSFQDTLEEFDASVAWEPWKMFDKLKEKFYSLAEIETKSEGLNTFLRNLVEFVKKFEEALSVDSSIERMELFMDVMKRFAGFIKDVLEPALENFSIGGAISIGSGVGIIYAIVELARALNKFAQFGIGNTYVTVPAVLESMKNTLTAYQKALKADALIKVAGAIAILAGSLVLLSFADPKRLIISAYAFGSVAAILMYGLSKLTDSVKAAKTLTDSLYEVAKGFGKAIKSFGTAIVIKSLGSTLKDFGTTIALISASMVGLALMYRKDKESLMAGVKIVGIMTTVILSVIAIMSVLEDQLKSGMKSFQKAAFSVFAVSLSLTIVISALNKLFKMDIPEDWKLKVGLLAGIFGGLIVLANMLGTASRISGGKKLQSGPIIAMSLLMISVVQTLKTLFKMDIPEDWQKRLLLLAGILAGVSGLVVALGFASRLSGGSIKAAGTVLSLVLFIGSIVAALMVLQMVPYDKLIRASASLGIILISLAFTLAGASKIMGGKETAKAITSMGTVIGAITIALGALSFIPAAKLLKSSVAIGSVLIAMAQTLKSASKITNKISSGNIIKMSGVLLIITGTLHILAKNDWRSILASGASISAAILAFTKAFEILSKTRRIKKESILGFYACVVAALPIALALKELSKSDWKGMAAAGLALSLAIVSFAGAFDLISLVNATVEDILPFYAMLVALLPISKALSYLADYSWDRLLGAATAIAETLISMSIAMAICTAIGAAVVPAIAGIILLDLFIANFYEVLKRLGSLTKDPNVKEVLINGADTFGLMGSAIGNFIGSIVKGIASNMSSSLPQLGEDLSGFMTNSQAFFEGLKQITFDSVKGAFYLASVMTILTAGSVINAIGMLLGGPVSLLTLESQLTAIGRAVRAFADEVEGVDGETLVASAQAAEILIGLGDSIPHTKNLFDYVQNMTDVKAFGTNLKLLAEALVEYSNAITANGGIDHEAVNASVEAGNLLVALIDSLPPSGGVLQTRLNELFGEKDVKAFGQDLVTFAIYLRNYANIVSDIDEEAVSASARVGDLLVELADSVPESGGLAGLLAGNNDIDDFGNRILKFATSLRNYANIVSGIDLDAVEGSANAGQMLADLANSIPNSGSKLFGYFNGNSDIDNFGDLLNAFADSLKSYAEKVSGGINYSGIYTSAKAFERLIEVVDEFKDVDVTEMTNFMTGLEQTALDGVDNFCNAFTDQDTESKMKTAIQSLAKIVKQAIKDEFSDIPALMEQAGRDISTGLERGLGGTEGNVKKAMSNLAAVGHQAFRKKMDINSPSKVMIQEGFNIVEGLVEGIEKKKFGPAESMEYVAESVVDAMSIMTDTSGIEDDISNSLKELEDAIEAGGKDIVKADEKNIQSGKKNNAKKKELQEEALTAEDEYWKKLLEIKKEGAEAAEYKDMTVKEFEENILEETTEVLKKYTDQLQSTRDEIMNSTDLFSEVSKKESKTKEEITKNLKDQIKELEEYEKIMVNLNARLGDADLGEYLRSLGVDSIEQLKVINSMTDEELANYASLYDEKMRIATRSAQAQLTSLQQETELRLQELFGSMYTAVDVFDFAGMFDGSLESLNAYLERFIIPFENAAIELRENAAAIGDGVSEGIKEGLTNAGVPETMSTMFGEWFGKMKEEQYINAHETGSGIGENIDAGVAEGMQDSSAGTSAAKTIVTNILEALRSNAEIASPSGLMQREVGPYITEGIAQGMLDRKDVINDAVLEILNGITSYISGDDGDLLRSSVEALIDKMLSAIKRKSTQFSLEGSYCVNNFLNQFKMKYFEATTVGTTTVTNVLTAIKMKIQEFYNAGVKCATQYCNGIKSMYPTAFNTGNMLATYALDGVKLSYQYFFEAGVAAGQGFVDGLSTKFEEASEAGKAIALAAYRAAMKAIKAQSPSRLFREGGGYAGTGFVLGILDQVSNSEEAGKTLAKGAYNSMHSAVKEIRDMVDNDMDIDPVIHPFVDLSDVRRSTQDIMRMFGDAVSVTASNAISTGNSINNSRSSGVSSKDTLESEEKYGNHYSFVQNNYSPKSLSRIDIYRQTRNQFTQFKEAVDKA